MSDSEFRDIAVDEDATGLWERANFRGLVSRLGRSGVLAVFTGVTGIILSFRRGLENLFEGGMVFVTQVSSAVVAIPVGVAEAAAAQSAASVAGFDLFAILAGAVVALATLWLMRFAFMVIVGEVRE